ncbi:hypothetical protein BpJC4_15300 [Weizmannia acidilactici]|nr:hypothetical protein BpJC4_15300 [Weizmannia acidilactici]
MINVDDREIRFANDASAGRPAEYHGMWALFLSAYSAGVPELVIINNKI